MDFLSVFFVTSVVGLLVLTRFCLRHKHPLDISIPKSYKLDLIWVSYTAILYYYICPAPLHQPPNYPPKLAYHTFALQGTLRPHLYTYEYTNPHLSLSLSFCLQPLIGQYPPPPPVATGPGLDRPIFPNSNNSSSTADLPGGGGGAGPLPPSAQQTSGGYTMMRTRKFYQDQNNGYEGGGGGTSTPQQGGQSQRSYSVESPSRRGAEQSLQTDNAAGSSSSSNRGYR